MLMTWACEENSVRAPQVQNNPNQGRLFLTESNLISLTRASMTKQSILPMVFNSQVEPGKQSPREDKYIEVLRMYDKAYLREKQENLEREKVRVEREMLLEETGQEGLARKLEMLKSDVSVIKKRVHKIQKTLRLIEENMDDHTIIMNQANNFSVGLFSGFN